MVDVERGEPPSKGGDNSRRSTNGSVDVGSAAALPGVPTTAGSSPSTCRAIARTFQRIVLAMIALGLLGGLVALVWIFMGPIFVLQLVLVVIVAYFVSGGRLRWFYIAFKTAPRDITALSRFIRLMWAIKCHEKKNRSVADVFQQFVAKHPNKSCFVFEDREWTFQEIEDLSNKVAYVFKSHGYRKGDVVALLMENRPEYVAIWLGLSKLGVTIPLINTNLRKTSLLHCINVARCQALIFSDELSESVSEIASSLDAKIALYKFDGKLNTNSSGLKEKDLSVLLDDASSSPLVLQEKGTYNDKLMYIYTSGTTGLPKAAVITNYKFMFIAGAMYYLGKFKTSDRFYTPLPLYHTAGGIVCVGQVLLQGATCVIRKKFSASAYFDDCRKYNCTVAQYIGEMCRYILASPPKPEDTQHKVRAIFGNGLRPQIWSEFIERFNIKQVAEFYGATESNANITNVDNKVGAIGFVSRIIPAVYPISIIKVNADGDPIRNEKGLCQECKPNEPGVFIGKIIPNNPHRAFLGYVDEKASERKVIHDVFKKGDSAFHSGDIVVADEFGYLYFKDRTGDTFRWKGENVSTSEVEAILSNLTNYRDCVVYGVEVTGSEGRAGMAAIHDENETLDLNEFVKNVKENLPSYARPLFIRILTKIDLTGTFKLKKKDLQEEGYNPRKVNDKLYYLDPKSGYQLITPEVYDQILQGKIRF
ncbi:long-chain fatty acid transport protein 4-like isoform X2 [Cotesia glomerata]|uniref:long-chain fatty acid transport protein 4-like isoform X2 n=1 Tax=Cotesia glomerata TaxID=32391 RepID=UPI001D0071E8|nr:long-chain fatty acid transport protein 4-like isoform X2 [Cotesia glomerata]